MPKPPMAALAMMALGALGAAGGAAANEADRWREQVLAAERAFAKTMADRDHAAFGRHVADEAVFFAGGGKVLRGRAEVLAGWKPFFEKAEAPFAWEPDQVEVLAGGSLALSTGPVRDPAGKPVARFNSIWRQEAPGVWRVVFDRGEPLPAPAPPR